MGCSTRVLCPGQWPAGDNGAAERDPFVTMPKGRVSEFGTDSHACQVDHAGWLDVDHPGQSTVCPGNNSQGDDDDQRLIVRLSVMFN